MWGGDGCATLVGGARAGRSWATSKCGAVDVRLSRVMVSVFGVSAGVFRSTSISASGLYWRGSPISLMMRISPFLANREVSHIRFVTPRLLEPGLKPAKGHSVPFALNKTNPFGSTNSTKVPGLGV